MFETDNVQHGDEHDCPQCPSCSGYRTRPLDDTIAHCFDCDIEWEGDFADLRQ